MHAVSHGDGGLGRGFFIAGFRTAAAGLYGIQPHRTAADIAPEMIPCSCRTLEAA